MNETETRPVTRADMLQPNAVLELRERGALGKVSVDFNPNTGTINVRDTLALFEFAKIVSTADVAIPKYLRGNPGACLAICMQANEWGMSPFAVANQSYSVNDRIGYQSMLIHSVVERRAPLKERLQAEWSGNAEDGSLTCTVTGWLHGDSAPKVWESPKLKDIKIKNSPEWSANPRKQIFYHASRDWARIWVPDVLLGIYTRDELMSIEAGPAGPAINNRKAPTEPVGGFDPNGITNALASARSGPRDQARDIPAGTDDASPEDVETEAEAMARMAADFEASRSATAGAVTDVEHTPAIDWTNTEPTTREEYAEYFDQWLAQAGDKEGSEQRWEIEKPLRAKCRVPVQARKGMEKRLNERFK